MRVLKDQVRNEAVPGPSIFPRTDFKAGEKTRKPCTKKRDESRAAVERLFEDSLKLSKSQNPALEQRATDLFKKRVDELSSAELAELTTQLYRT